MSGERIVPERIKSQEEYCLYLREVFIYDWCKTVIPGNSYCLDLGCGDGYGTKLLASSVKNIIGLDIDKKLIEKASAKYGTDNCSFKAHDGEELPFADDAFDAVISLQVIEHVKDDLGFISQVYRVLKKGGLFILTTPNRVMRLPSGMPPWNIYHIREYSADELRRLLGIKFGDVKIWGLSAVDEVMKIERARIKRSIAIAKWDFLNLRRRLPLPITAMFIKALNYMLSYRSKASMKENAVFRDFRASDLYRIEEAVSEESLDIIGICRKQ